MVEKLNRKLTMIVVALAVALFAQFFLPFRLGLDLEGGTRLTYSVDIAAARTSGVVSSSQTDQEVMSELVAIWTERVDPTGTRGVVIRRVGSNRVVIEIPGSASAVANNVESRLAQDISASDKIVRLELSDEANWDRFPATGGVIQIDGEELNYLGRQDSILEIQHRGATKTTPAPHAAGASVKLLAADPWKSLIENTGRMEFFIQAIDSDDLAGVSGTDIELQKAKAWIDSNPDLPIADYNLKLATENVGSPLERLRFFPMKVTAADLARELKGPELLKERLRALIVESDPKWRFAGADVSAVRQTVDDIGFPAVGFDIKSDRGTAFGNFTKAHIDKNMAIVINDEIVTMPEIQAALVNGGTINGGARGFKLEEVQDLIKVLKSGSLKISPKFESEESVGATLGADYVRRGTISSIVGLIAVVVFGVVYYRLLGLFTAISLGVNLLMLLGAMRLMQTTLTLPGVAGIVLTVGMAIDANILIFERVREEMLKGRKTLQAAKDGYANALSTILDANITTLITGLILFFEGSGPVKGFAATLCIGILTSLFSALVVTRVLMHFAFERGVEKFTMMRFVGDTSYKFMGSAKKCIAGSAFFVVVGVVLFTILPAHEKFGIDFIGGNTMTIVTRVPETKQDMATAIQGINETFKAAVVQEIRSSEVDGKYRQFRVEFKSAADDAGDGNVYRATVQRALGDRLSRGPIEVTANTGEVQGALYFEQEHPIADIEAKLGGISLSEAKVLATPDDAGATYTFTARSAATSTEQELHDAIVAAFADEQDSQKKPYSWERPIPQSESVGPQVVQELRDDAIFAILLSLFAVVMYIRVRFSEYSYGLAAVAALVHDVLITLGVLAVAVHWDLVEAEINLTMIAAFLTIIGYSLNDTIVVFDRIRENLPKFQRPMSEVIDMSVNQTLSRTLLTSGTTILAVFIMFIFNVGTRNALESFGFAMLTGILIGTYSSIFIASPVLLWLETRRMAKGGGEVTVLTKTPVADLP